MNTAIAFISAFASTLFVGAISRYAAGFFASDRASRIAAFGVTVGYAIGRFSYSAPATVEELPALSAALGAIAALLAAWAWLLRKGASKLIDPDV